MLLRGGFSAALRCSPGSLFPLLLLVVSVDLCLCLEALGCFSLLSFLLFREAFRVFLRLFRLRLLLLHCLLRLSLLLCREESASERSERRCSLSTPSGGPTLCKGGLLFCGGRSFLGNRASAFLLQTEVEGRESRLLAPRWADWVPPNREFVLLREVRDLVGGEEFCLCLLKKKRDANNNVERKMKPMA